MYIKVPIIPAIKVGEIVGDLSGKGITITVGVKGVLSGTITLFVKDGWLYISFELQIYKKKYGPKTLRLFRLP